MPCTMYTNRWMYGLIETDIRLHSKTLVHCTGQKNGIYSSSKIKYNVTDLIYLLISDLEVTELVTINQTHFTVNAIPSCQGGHAH